MLAVMFNMDTHVVYHRDSNNYIAQGAASVPDLCNHENLQMARFFFFLKAGEENTYSRGDVKFVPAETAEVLSLLHDDGRGDGTAQLDDGKLRHFYYHRDSRYWITQLTSDTNAGTQYDPARMLIRYA
jgi:hypothetical protein